MRLPLVSNEEVRASNQGRVVINDCENPTILEEEMFDTLSKEYTRMVQENPEHVFAILRDGNKGVTTISWNLRI